MKRTYISPEHTYERVKGTLEMKDEKNYFSSLIMNLPPVIEIDDRTIIWYEDVNLNQIDLTQEELLPPKINFLSDSKRDNHTLIQDEDQSEYERLNLTRWDLTINYKKILEDYLFSEIKKRRTFENVLNSDVNFNNINLAIRDYINKNIMNKYKFDKIEIFINYKNLDFNNNYKFQNTWVNSSQGLEKLERFNIQKDQNIDISFRQEKKGSEWNFEYYFNLKFNLR